MNGDGDDEDRARKSRPLTKGEFVCAMVLLAQRDRAAYRRLRALGWDSAILRDSDFPN